MSEFQTVNQEIAVELDQVFRCLAARDWDGLSTIVAIPDGQADPFAALAALDRTGLLALTTSLDAQMVRTTGPEGASVDVGWRVGDQLRFERWTFERRDTAPRAGAWLLTLVEPGVPLYDGAVVGMTGRIAAGAVTLTRGEIANPGEVELRLDVGADAAVGDLVVMFPEGACALARPSPLVAIAEVADEQVTLAIDDPAAGDYILALVPRVAPISREIICTSPTAVLRIVS